MHTLDNISVGKVHGLLQVIHLVEVYSTFDRLGEVSKGAFDLANLLKLTSAFPFNLAIEKTLSI